MSTKKQAAATELVVKETTALAGIPMGAWGAENTVASDLVIPRILLMQAMSKMCQNDKIAARAGEIRGSLDGKLLGGKDKPLRVIPFYFTSTWVKFEMKNGKFEFIGVEDRDATNEDLPWEVEAGGKKFKNTKAINFFVLIPSEVETGEFLPYVMSFQNTSFAAGRKLVTLAEKLKQFKVPMASKVFEISVSTKQNDKGSWFIFDQVEQVGDSKDFLPTAFEWYQKVSKGGVKVDESHMEDEAVSATSDKF